MHALRVNEYTGGPYSNPLPSSSSPKAGNSLRRLWFCGCPSRRQLLTIRSFTSARLPPIPKVEKKSSQGVVFFKNKIFDQVQTFLYYHITLIITTNNLSLLLDIKLSLEMRYTTLMTWIRIFIGFVWSSPSLRSVLPHPLGEQGWSHTVFLI